MSEINLDHWLPDLDLLKGNIYLSTVWTSRQVYLGCIMQPNKKLDFGNKAGPSWAGKIPVNLPADRHTSIQVRGTA